MYVVYARATGNPIAYFLTVEGAQNYMNLVGKTKVYLMFRED